MKWREILAALYGKLDSLRRNYRDRHITYREQIVRWLKNRHLQYRIISLEEAGEFKKSDTIFIIGSGPSIMDVTPAQWSYIKKHDSFGINYSFLLDFVPTFHQQEYGRTDWLRKLFKEVFSSRREMYSNTVWFLSSREYKRALHPRYTPELLPKDPICCFYEYPSVIRLESNRPFTKSDFEKAIVYRGSLTVVLYLVLQLQYKNIVLLGVDLETPSHFFDDMPEMRRYIENQRQAVTNMLVKTYWTMIPKGDKYHGHDKYLYALNDLYCKTRGIKLYVQSEKCLLYPKIPCYNFD